MSDILSRKELGAAPRVYLLRDYRATALWLAEKGRLAAYGTLHSSCDRCPLFNFESGEPASCGYQNGGEYPCDLAAKELLEWWGEG